jgi:hypothetical protein
MQSADTSHPSPFAHPIHTLAYDIVSIDAGDRLPHKRPNHWQNCPPNPLIDSHIVSKLESTLLHAWASNTLEKYRQGVNHFLSFCDSQNVSSCFRLPASEFLLCAFAASSAGERSGSAVRNDISAIRAWHIINNVPYFGNIRLNYTLKGVENLTPESSRRPKRPPITLDMLILLYEHLDLNDSLDACCWAAAVVAFWGQVRLGELLSKWQSKYIPGVIPTPSDLDHHPANVDTIKLHLPFTKTKGKRGETIYICPQNGCSNPLPALTNHLLINKIPDHLPLFSYHSHKGLLALTSRKLLARCNSIWSQHGLPSCSGHSFRIGGTTELLLCSVPPHIVKLLGRWSSDAFLRYWRDLEHIAPLHASFLKPRVRAILPTPTQS